MTVEAIQTADEQAVVPYQPRPVSVFGTDDPTGIVQRTTQIADALAGVIRDKQMSVSIQGRDYVKIEGWSFLGSMLGVFPRTVSVQPIDDEACETHAHCGFEAHVELVTRDGAVVGGGVAECSRHERSWKDRDSYALRSMAQTRATGKAYRMAFGFVMSTAGYEATPAEEMPSPRQVDARVVAAKPKETPAGVCKHGVRQAQVDQWWERAERDNADVQPCICCGGPAPVGETECKKCAA